MAALAVIVFTLMSAFSAQQVSAQISGASESASSVTPTSTVPSPVFLSGASIRQSDTTSGDLVIASGNTVIAGEVLDDVYVVTGTLVIEGTVRGNVIIAAGEVIISPQAQIDGSVIVLAQRLSVSGRIGSALQATAEHVILQGSVGGVSSIYAQKLSLLDTAQISTLEGNVQELEQVSGSSVANRENFTVQPKEERPTQPVRQLVAYFVWGAVQGAFLGVILWFLTRAVWPGALVQIQTQLGSVLAWGLTLGLVWPALAMLLIATIVGLPLMILGTTVWLGFLWLGWVIPALALATHSEFLPALSKMPVWAKVLLVSAIWGALMTLPWAGWMLRIVSGLIGLGLVVLSIKSRWVTPRRKIDKK
jgi:cytoskeletal protein CcmA (bactofilin family)